MQSSKDENSDIIDRMMQIATSESSDRIIFDPDATIFIQNAASITANIKYRFGYSVIWVDRFRQITDRAELFKAVDASLNLYWSDWGDYKWQHLYEELIDESNLPEKGCLLLFSSLSSLKTNHADEYSNLLSLLGSVRLYWSRNDNYHLRIVISGLLG